MTFITPGPGGRGDTVRAVEIHYFRVARERWELMLLRAAQSGANTISTYIPWAHHAPAPDVLDLTGETNARRDVVGFLDLCAELNFAIIAKPGPFVDSEIMGGGLPPWLCERHPELWAKTYDGRIYRHSDSNDPRFSYDSPEYHALAEPWLRAIAAVLVPHRDRLVAVQVDNETPGDGFLIHEDDVDPSPLRADHASPQRWSSWLEANRGDASDVALAWGVDGAADLGLPATWEQPENIAALRRYADADRFADHQLAAGLDAFAKILRDAVPDEVPLFHDWLCMPWQIAGMLIEPGAMSDTCGWIGQNVYAEDVEDDTLIAGTEWYRMNFEEYVHHAWWRTRLCSTLSTPGLPHLVPEVSARQQFYLHCHLIGGMDAPVIYVLPASDPEPRDIGAGQEWAAEAPISPDGSPRPQWANMRTLFAILAAGGEDLAASPLPAPVAVVYDHAGEHIARYGGVIPGSAWSNAKNLSELAAGANTGRASNLVAQQLVAAGIDFDIVDATRTSLESYAAIVVPAVSVMSQGAQDAVAQRIIAGSRVFAAGQLPTLDEDLRDYVAISDLDPLDPNALAAALDADSLRSAVVDQGGIDVSCRVGRSARYLTVVNRSGTPWTGDVRLANGDVVPVSSGHGTVAWARVDAGGTVSAALISGRNAYVGDIRIERGQAAITRGSSGWEVVASDPGSVWIPGAAGLDAYRVTLHGSVLTAGVVGADGLLDVVVDDDAGATDRYVLGDVAVAQDWASHAHRFTELSWAQIEREFGSIAERLAELQIEAGASFDPDFTELATRLHDRDLSGLARSLPRMRSRLVAGSAAPGTDEIERALTRIGMRHRDLALGRS